jgi:hypothetical protein
LVGDDSYGAPLPHELQHGEHEVAAAGIVDPGGAQHHGGRERGAHRDFTFEFRHAVDIQRVRRITWHIQLRGVAVEYEIGG